MKKEMVEKIEDEIKQKTKLPNDIKEKTRKNIFINIVIAIIAISYLVFLILRSTGSAKNDCIIEFNILSMLLLGIAIGLFEFAYKKDNGSIAMYGIEALIIALTTLFLPYVIFEVNQENKKYYLLVSSYIGIYYIIKCIYISLRAKRKYLEEQSDIKDIVKKEQRKINSQDIEIEQNQKNKTENNNKQEKTKIEQSIKIEETHKIEKTKGSTPKKTDKKPQNETNKNEIPKKRGRPKKQVEQKQENKKENTPNKSKENHKKVNTKQEKVENANVPKKRGRPRKQEMVEKEKTKTEETKTENVPKKRGRPRKVVTEQ